MNIAISAFIIGFTAAALPGAVQTTVAQSALLGKSKASLKLALGAAFMDSLFLSLAYFGLIQFIVDYSWLALCIGILGIIYMVALGTYGVFKVLKKKKEKFIDKGGFLKGILLVILHPPTIIYFISVSGTLFTQTEITNLLVIFSSIFLFMGAISCFIIIYFIALLIRKSGKQNIIIIFQITTSILLIVFAGKLFFQLI